jgi:hypothetical protein
MKITIERGSYNHRRYSKPWIAKIGDWPGGKATLEWGHYYGDDGGGTLEIDVDAGDIVRMGQKDYRHPKNESHWYMVEDGGKLRELEGESEARKLWLVKSNVKS